MSLAYIPFDFERVMLTKKLTLMSFLLHQSFRRSLKAGRASNLDNSISIMKFTSDFIISERQTKYFIVQIEKLQFLSQFVSKLINIYKRMQSSDLGNQNHQRKQLSDDENMRKKSRSRSREKKSRKHNEQSHLYLRKFDTSTKKLGGIQQSNDGNNILNFSRIQNAFSEQNTENDRFKEVVRSLLRIEQGRDQVIDKFAKIVWTYKNRLHYDHNLHQIMTQPTKYINKLADKQVETMIPIAQQHKNYELFKNSKFQQYWDCIIYLLTNKFQKSLQKYEQIKEDYQYKIKQIIKKTLPELIKLQKQANLILKSQNYGSSHDYWKYVLQEVKNKRIELILQNFYEQYKQTHLDIINQSLKQEQDLIYEEPTSPTLLPFTSVTSKLIATEEDQTEFRKKLAEKIFKEQFQKGQERLQINLSLPHNHSLLSTQIITEQTDAYDHITKEIIEFEKYKRMEDDQQQFNDWVPCQTQGRFRDQKPYYINRVRVACEWNKYNSTHYTEQNPPPKTIQGYKFNIFYPQLYDKQKTPQYYLEETDDPNYCIIKFKAGPPYKDIAFKILKKQWDFTLKSGFESIFSKGILQLCFNFKKPKFRI